VPFSVVRGTNSDGRELRHLVESCEDRCHELTFTCQRRPTNPIHTGPFSTQTAAMNAVLDRVARESEREKLDTRDHVVLAPNQRPLGLMVD
jgi:hypothetical protein